VESAYGIVYLIQNKVNGKKYVGQTICRLNARWRQHRHSAKKGSTYPIHAAIRKYGPENFSVSLLEAVPGVRAALIDAEKSHIQQQCCIAPAGYNLSEGGEGVDFTSDVIRERHRKAVVNRKENNPSWYQHTIEAAQKRAKDPEWLTTTLERLRKFRSTPDWLSNTVKALEKGRASLQKNMLARDKLLTQEDLALRIKRRAAVQRSAAKRRSPDYLDQTAKDALLPPSELARRIVQRERVRRSHMKMSVRLKECLNG
jgi:group I intron endonuclease